MDDSLKDAGIAIVSLALFSFIIGDRVSHSARRDLRTAIPSGRIDVRLVPRFPMGEAFGQFSKVTISGSRFTTDELPFRIESGGGLADGVGHIKLDLRDIVLHDLPVKSLTADIPGVSADAPYVLFGGHFRIRSAREGTGIAIATAEGLQSFMAKTRPQFQDLRIRLLPGEAIVTAKAALFGPLMPIEARGKLAVSEGRYLNAVDATVLLNGKPIPAAMTASLLKTLNPVIDVERDLKLGKWLYVTGAEIGDGILTVHAKVTIPKKE